MGITTWWILTTLMTPVFMQWYESVVDTSSAMAELGIGFLSIVLFFGECTLCILSWINVFTEKKDLDLYRNK